jgi:hypothetical protein
MLGPAPIPPAAALASLACMGNSLLDFVMALVRDPQAAARYAADPAGALADAHLPGVTLADVQSLIPVVTDSLAMATPDFGAVVDTANVWTSGAAVAAFDAFGIPHPAPIAQPAEPQFSAVTADFTPDLPDLPDPGPAPEPVVVDPIVDHEPVGQNWDGDAGWSQHLDPQTPDHHPTDHPGFDLF